MPNTGSVAEQGADVVACVVDGRRITGPVRQEHAVGLAGEHFGRGRGCRHHLDLTAGCDELVEDRPLDAEVVRDHEQARVVGADGVRRRRRDPGDEVAAVGASVGLRGREQRVAVGRAERAGHRAGRTNVARQAAGVDAGDAGHLMTLEIAARGLPSRASSTGRRASSRTITPRQRGSARFVVVGVDAVVADVRVRERDDLTGVRGVGDDLLVTGERGVEHDLAGDDPRRRAGARPRSPRTSSPSASTNRPALSTAPPLRYPATVGRECPICMVRSVIGWARSRGRWGCRRGGCGAPCR